MNIQPVNSTNQGRLHIRFSHYFLLLLAMLMPLSCSAQKNVLSRISSTERSDGKGHVIRFHLNNSPTSYNYSQPQAYLVQLELKGQNLDSTSVQLQDDSKIIESIDYYAISGGLGIDLFLKEDVYYRAEAYPDQNKTDILIGLTKTAGKQLAAHIKSMQMFAWSNAPQVPSPFTENNQQTNNSVAIDSSYQRVKDKIDFDVVVIDAGHGGHDVGTHHNGVYEKDVVLNIAKKVGNYIKQSDQMQDVKVVYTRDDDTFIELEERGPIANRAEGDLFVSIHANAVPSAPSARGTETYFLGLERSESALRVMERENKIVNPDGEGRATLTQEELAIYELANSGYIASSEKLAGMIESQFKNRAQRHSRGVKQARFVVLYQASMPAVLIETGFLSNPSEARYLNSDRGQTLIASAIFRAIRNYKVQFEQSQNL